MLLDTGDHSPSVFHEVNFSEKLEGFLEVKKDKPSLQREPFAAMDNEQRAAFISSNTSVGYKSASILLLCEAPTRCHRGGSSESECTLSVNLKDERFTSVSEVKTEHKVCECV